MLASCSETSHIVVIDCSTSLSATEGPVFGMPGWCTLLRHGGGAWARRPIAAPLDRPWGGADDSNARPRPDGDKTHNVRFTGPVWQGTPQPADQPEGEPGIGEPERRLVSRPAACFQSVLDALSGHRCGLSSQAALVPTENLRRRNMSAFHSAHAEVLPTVSLVIGHGSHACDPPSRDLPVIVLPM
jgi:hypothetical protein